MGIYDRHITVPFDGFISLNAQSLMLAGCLYFSSKIKSVEIIVVGQRTVTEFSIENYPKGLSMERVVRSFAYILSLKRLNTITYEPKHYHYLWKKPQLHHDMKLII